MAERFDQSGEFDSGESNSIPAWVRSNQAAETEAGEPKAVEASARRLPQRAAEPFRPPPTIRLPGSVEGALASEVETETSDADREAAGRAEGPGRLGDFEIVREVGRGGMGVVYEARQLSLGRRVALKVLPHGVALDPRQILRFQLEAQVAGGLNHPHIVPVYAVGSAGGTHFYAMQLIEGRSLAEVIRDMRRLEGTKAPRPLEEAARTLATGPLGGRPAAVEEPTERNDRPEAAGSRNWRDVGPGFPGPTRLADGSRPGSSLYGTRAFVRTVTGIGLQTAEALAYAHEQGVVHRDVKPSNLIVDGRGDVWITDFGVARLLGNETLTAPGDVLGTLRYMSPEQALSRRETIDHRTDIYSLGVTLYELLTLQPAVEGRDRQELLHRIVHEEPRPLRRLNRSVPRELETIVQKAMAKDPADRYATAQGFAEDLRRFLEDQPVRARRPSVLERMARWSRRRCKWVAAGFAFLLIVAIVATMAAVRINEARREAVGVAARHAMDNGLSLCERGEVGRGMLGLARALPLAEAAGDPRLPRVIRANLEAWRRRLTELVAVLPHPGPIVHRVAVSPDGRTILTGCEGGTAQLWDALDGSPIGPALVRGVGIGALAFSPDSATIVIGSLDGFAWVLDTRNGQPRRPPLKIPGGGRVLAFSPDGRTLLTDGPPRSVHLWDVAEGRPIGRAMRHAGRVTVAAFSPDGRRIATGSLDDTVRLWDAATQASVGEPLTHEGDVTALAFTPAGDVLLTGSHDRTARRWDVATGRPIGNPWMHGDLVLTLAVSPDGQTAATGGAEGAARVWDLRQPDPTGRFLRHGGWVHDLAFSPDGRTILTASGDNQGRLWDVATGTPVSPPLVHGSTVRSIAIGPDGRTILTGGHDRRARLWRAPAVDATIRMASELGFYTVALSPRLDSLLACDVDGKLRLWDVATGKGKGPYWPGVGRSVSLRFSPDGSNAVTSDGTTTLIWRDIRNRPAVVRIPYGGEILDAAFRPDGATLATGCKDGTVRLWDASSLRALGEVRAHDRPVLAVAFSHDGRQLISGGLDGSARVWDASTLAPLGPALRHEGWVRVVGFGPSGRYAVVGGSDMTVQVWDVSSGRPVGSPMRQTGAVAAAVLSPDDRFVLTACADGTARFWDVATSRPVGPPLTHDSAVHAVGFTPDGRFALTGSLDRTVRRWPVPLPIAGDWRDLLSDVERITGLEAESSGAIRVVPSPRPGPPRPPA